MKKYPPQIKWGGYFFIQTALIPKWNSIYCFLLYALVVSASFLFRGLVPCRSSVPYTCADCFYKRRDITMDVRLLLHALVRIASFSPISKRSLYVTSAPCTCADCFHSVIKDRANDTLLLHALVRIASAEMHRR